MLKIAIDKKLSQNQCEEIIKILKMRFGKNMARHKDIVWSKVEAKLKDNTEKLWSLSQMEKTGGEPDVVIFDKKFGELIFCDCSPESPSGRRSLCYDREALESRKENKPKNSAVSTAETMGIEILTEDQYGKLQELGNFDIKTQSWVKTPNTIRKLGGAIFCDRRYNAVFTYHNGAESYYAVRGFRAMLKV